MLEISILCVIALAMAYWTALWLMGRREDVLHGDFIKTAPKAKTAEAAPQRSGSVRAALPPLVLPAKPVVLDTPKPTPAPLPVPIKPQAVAVIAAEPVRIVAAPAAPSPAPVVSAAPRPAPVISEKARPAPVISKVSMPVVAAPAGPEPPRPTPALIAFRRAQSSPTSFDPASLAPLPPARTAQMAPGGARPAPPLGGWRRPAPAQPESLQSLLDIIKRDLGDAAAE